MNDAFGDALVETAEAIKSKSDFVEFLSLLLENYRDHQDEWENASVDQFVQAMWGFASNMEGYYENIGVDVDVNNPSWRTLADVLLAGRVYE